MVSVSGARDGGVMTLAVAGEIDLATGPAVADAIMDALATDGIRTVTVDLSEVTFLDSSAIALLLKGRREADSRGVGYRVTGVTGIPREILQIAGVWQHLSGGTGAAGSSDRS